MKRISIRSRSQRSCCAWLVTMAAPAVAHTTKDVGAYTVHGRLGKRADLRGAAQQRAAPAVRQATGKPYRSSPTRSRSRWSTASRRSSTRSRPTFDVDTGFGTPGDYRAWFFPTAPGDYTFHFTGTIGAQKVDESFKSGPTTFSTVEDPSDRAVPGEGADERAARAAHRRRASADAHGQPGVQRQDRRLHRHRPGRHGIAIATVALLRRRA